MMMRSISLLLILLPLSCEALSSAASVDFRTVNLKSMGPSQLAVLDGGEWASVQAILQEENVLKRSTRNGYMTIVAGRNEDNQRVVAMQCPDDKNAVFEDSVALVPDKISESDAISTYIVSLSAVYSVLPKAEQVGGSDDSVIAGKVVVLGGNELACFAAEGLASMGVEVSLVSPGSPKVNKNIGKLNILKPAVGSSKNGFSSHVGQFDSLLDTLSDERPSTSFLDLEDEDEDEETDSPSYVFGGSTLGLLKSRHNCHKYVSTLTHCQSIVAKEGIFGGPGQTEKYAQRVGRTSFLTSPDCQPILPPQEIGNTMETMFENGIVFYENQRKKLYQKSDSVRGWSLADFWEQTSWPRDSSGSGSVRFGLPVVEEWDPDMESLISAAPQRSNIFVGKSADPVPPKRVQENPYVQPIDCVSVMQSEIEEAGVDCILFLSAKFCKTCKVINPKFTRMARQAQDTSPIVFAKAEVSGRWGKELGKFLEVDAVPAFIFFRNGKRFGTPLSASKLPSKKIEYALKLLESGSEWDASILMEES